MNDEDWGQAVGFSCIDCRFFDVQWANEDESIGLCRRFPPVGPFTRERPSEHIAAYPEVSGHDWCGEFSLEPSKAAEWSLERLKRIEGGK